MKKESTYWLSHTPTEKFNLIELAHTQRAISNFVKILTKEDIPVEFFECKYGESMTNGKEITISSTINMHNIDSVVGLAIHEGAHCIYTDFFVPIIKLCLNKLSTNPHPYICHPGECFGKILKYIILFFLHTHNYLLLQIPFQLIRVMTLVYTMRMLYILYNVVVRNPI